MKTKSQKRTSQSIRGLRRSSRRSSQRKISSGRFSVLLPLIVLLLSLSPTKAELGSWDEFGQHSDVFREAVSSNSGDRCNFVVSVRFQPSALWTVLCAPARLSQRCPHILQTWAWGVSMWIGWVWGPSPPGVCARGAIPPHATGVTQRCLRNTI